MTDLTYPITRCYSRDDGTFVVPSGAEIQIESGGVIRVNGGDVTASVTGANAAGVGSGYIIARGETTLDGSNPTSVTTGLGAVVAASATFKSATVLGDDPNSLTVDYGGSVPAGRLDFYAGKNASGTDPTQIASTNNTAVVSWIAVGTA